jgi:hypothetical protein
MRNATINPLPLEVGELGNFELRMTRNLRLAVEDWDEVCSALGLWEAAHLTTDDPAAARKQHRAWVSKLISWGQLLRQVTEHPEYSNRTVASRIEVRLRHLEDKLALWHRDMTPEEEDRILRAAFS